MSTFIRGPVCGTDNCPSRLWRVIAGRRTCQYGHVMEGDIEFNNDEDDVPQLGSMTRRLNLTTTALGTFQSSFNASQLVDPSSTKEQHKKIFGYDARILFLKAFQFILRKQSSYLLHHKNFPQEFPIVVKLVWSHYLKYVNDNDPLANATFSEDEDDDDEIPNSRARIRQRGRANKLGLNINTSVTILYLAAVHLRLPVYTEDFIQWICSSSFPYYKANDQLPKIWQKRLPNYYLGLLNGGRALTGTQFCKKIASTVYRTNFNQHFQDTINLPSLIFRLVGNTTLLPEFYFYTMAMIKRVEKSTDFPVIPSDKPSFNAYHQTPEMKVIAYFILSFRWVLLSDSSRKHKKQTFSSNWLRALKAFQTGWQDSESVTDDNYSNDTLSKQITELFSASDKTDPIDWSERKTLRYLNWLQTTVVEKQSSLRTNSLTIDQNIAQRKLHKLIPLKTDQFPLPTTTPGNITYVEDLQEKYLKVRASLDDDTLHVDAFDTKSNEREDLIARLEYQFLCIISAQFFVPMDILEDCVRRTEEHCLKQIES
ncbi:Rrn7p KNAG_0B05050 [Huiozyma naganishii CBS 8797]|uniref:Uncharacterized protein n=1 Tax=Huiozyma naganishii (strain ATCC MYA-139 / BCRC 22969 / CBS 8797 / KCTC 17520 / NBRC 10181 / NCYC 3082 / Yp74L-3) TaxID=1071383 RepID=J7S3W2_HUIN7|nr:hypothetical protein KNAG_0B05050 [Kazachstania naganishii CBS 8797]CCK68939.1 hypothetical protein KNAG_0B05050 [Kazachstania naganishii CBS 8797]